METYQTKPPDFGRWREVSSSSPEGRAVRTLVSSWASEIADKSRTGRRIRFGVCVWNIDIDTPIFYTKLRAVVNGQNDGFQTGNLWKVDKPAHSQLNLRTGTNDVESQGHLTRRGCAHRVGNACVGKYQIYLVAVDGSKTSIPREKRNGIGNGHGRRESLQTGADVSVGLPHTTGTERVSLIDLHSDHSVSASANHEEIR